MSTIALRHRSGNAPGQNRRTEPQHSSPDAGGESLAWVLTDQQKEPRYRLWHWLRDTELWQQLAQADLIHFKRLRKLTQRLWPNRPHHWDVKRRAYTYSRREIEALCAAAIAEREAYWADQCRLGRRGAGR
ncbi:MAG: hypothetical protein ACKOGI_07425 [Vulcanococcus sp.]